MASHGNDLDYIAFELTHRDGPGAQSAQSTQHYYRVDDEGGQANTAIPLDAVHQGIAIPEVEGGQCILFKKKTIGSQCKRCGKEAEAHPNWSTIKDHGKMFSSFHDAAHGGDLAAIKYFYAKTNIDTTNSLGSTPLLIACEHGHRDAVQFLLQNDASVKKTDMMSFTALHWVASKGFLDIAELLVTYGASIDPRDSDGNTPLHFAAEQGHVHVAEWLIQKGADPNARNSKKRTPLHLAAMTTNSSMVDRLMKLRADPLVKDSNGKTPIDLANAATRPVLQPAGGLYL